MTAARRTLAFVCCTTMLCAQNPAAFEVAAIKPGETGDRVGSGASFGATGLLRVINSTLESILTFAYGVKNFQVASGPSWMRSERFTITAKAPGEGPMTRADYTSMLQALLAERFHLKIRREMTDLSAYALMVDKNGPKMQASGPGEKYSESSGSAAVVPGATGGGSGLDLKFTAAKMDALVTRLGVYMKNRDSTPLLNLTGLQGSDNFTLSRTLEMSGGQDAPSIFSAIKDLGLKLEKGKFPVETIVIESVERPMFD